MRRVFVTAAILTGVVAANTGYAADMSTPAYKSAPVATYVVNWTGCYGGFQGGGLGTFNNFLGTGTFGAGPLAGGQIGCNYQISGFVFGLEADGFWADANANNTAGIPGASTTNSAKNRWDADITLRTGFAWDHYYVYNKLGATWGGFDFRSTFPGGVLSTSQTLPGFLEGIGAEYMISQQWSAKLEFDLMWYDAQTLNLACSGACLATTTSPMIFELAGKVGVNYHF
jgi:outer membrane immunogenic protein